VLIACHEFTIPLTVCQTLRYIRPPEGLTTQLDVYTEEKFEDEEDMRERASHLFHAGDRHNGSEILSILDELITVTGTHTEDYYNVIRIVRIMISFFQRLDERYGSRKFVIYLTTVPSTSSPLRTKISSIIATFVEQASSVDDLCDDTLQSLATTDIDQTGGLVNIPEKFHGICTRHHW